MTTDCDNARALLVGGKYTIVLCRGDDIVLSVERGVKPLITFIESGADLRGYSAADKVVGKAAALLYAYMGVTALYANVMSAAAKRVCERCGIAAKYEILADKIINRRGDDICPMEKATADIDDPVVALYAIKERLKSM